MKVHHRLLLLILLSVNHLNAQVDGILTQKNTTDLKNQIENTELHRVEEIISLSNILYKIAFKDEDATHMIDALKHLSTANLNAGNNIEAIEYLDRAIAVAYQHNIENKTIVNLLKLKGNHYFDIEEYDKATTTYYESLSIAKEINDAYAIWALQTNLGFVKLRSGDPKKALEDLKISDEILKNGVGEFAKHVPMLNKARICEAYIRLNELDSALIANDKGLALAKKVKIDNVHIDLLMHRGIIFKNKREYTQSLIHLNQAKELCYKANDIIFLGKILNLIAACKIEVKKYTESITALNESLTILTNKYSNSDELSTCYKLLGQSYKLIGDLERSNTYYEKHILSLTKLNSKKTSASKKIRDSTVADYQSEINTLENQTKKQKKKLSYSQIGAVVFGSGLLVVFFFFLHTKKKNKEKFDTLYAKIERGDQNVNERVEKNNSTSQSKIVDTKDVRPATHSNDLDISDELYEDILKGLSKIEAQEYYLKTECNLYNVAKKIGTNTSYLSKFINTHFQKNFHTYINDLRINYAIIKLKNDTKFRAYSIKSIAQEVGYKTADSFSKYFKIHTGLLPSFYIKKLKSKD